MADDSDLHATHHRIEPSDTERRYKLDMRVKILAAKIDDIDKRHGEKLENIEDKVNEISESLAYRKGIEAGEEKSRKKFVAAVGAVATGIGYLAAQAAHLFGSGGK